MKRIAINGLGRVGRLMLRRYLNNGGANFSIVAVNDPTPAENLAYLLKYDSVHGLANFEVRVEDDQLWLDDLQIQLYSETDPANLPWQKREVDLVIECSGKFNRRADAAKHITAGAKRVLIGAPSADADSTLVLGVNEQNFDPERHVIISNASCTTNSLAPPLKLLSDQFGIEAALVTTVHAYTSSQSLVDVAASKYHRGRAGAVNIIPTSTGADAATIMVLPELAGRLSALALRVPTPDGALTDISVVLQTDTDATEINRAFKAAAQGSMHGILDYSDDELVSTDIIGNPNSSIIHGCSTRVVRDRLVKVQAWYDNEYGYACRCLDMVELLA